MNWLIISEVAYIIILIGVCLRIIYDTRSHTKTFAYLLIAVFLPFFGMFIYFSFGINYRKRKIYSKKLINDEALSQKLQNIIRGYSKRVYKQHVEAVEDNKKLSYLLLNEAESPLTGGNEVKLLINGEEKFPEVLEAIKNAKHHVHIEYYIFEDGEIGQAIEQALIAKVKEGVKVRFIYDHFGSHSIHRSLVRRLREAGVLAFPFHRITFVALANRLNYRNHRKIIVIDGKIGFVGGINIADTYNNAGSRKNKKYWRDTHLRIQGPGVYYLQYIFLCDWNFSAGKNLEPTRHFFPDYRQLYAVENKAVQIAAGGPDSDMPTILFSLLQAIHQAKEEILITTPYYIPGESIQDALVVAGLSGIHVKLLVPGVPDSIFVNAAANSYYDDLLRAGVEIYRYQKGFIHAKTMVTDRKLAIVGTANMDQRSFDLNFEVNAIMYDRQIAQELTEIFYDDIRHATKIDFGEWENRPAYRKLIEKTAGLLSPML